MLNSVYSQNGSVLCILTNTCEVTLCFLNGGLPWIKRDLLDFQS